jgi:predicted  nucleic acid-binding Zn-ribbon protein
MVLFWHENLPPHPQHGYNHHMSNPSSLHRLQEVDQALDRARSRLQEIADALADLRELERRREALDAAEAQLQEARSTNRNAEHNAASQRTKIEETDKKLYSGTITNPKELEALQQESESLKRHLTTLDDRLLECMVALEEAEEAYAAAGQLVADAEQDRVQLEAELGGERSTLEEEIERLETEKEGCLASVSDEDLAVYEKLRKAKSGLVVSLMHDGCCSACGMSIPPAKQQSVRGMTELILCSQCGRILYAG